MTVAAILGLDTAAGAYLARLLGARGISVRGTGGAALLGELGIADDVPLADSATTAAIGADLVFDLRGNGDATIELIARMRQQRVFVAVEPTDITLIMALAAVRADGRFVATGRLYPNESRLGPGTSSVARIVAAAAAGHDPDPVDLATSSDCGWTPEYVDAMARMLALQTAADLTIATGRLLAGSDVARVAFRWFGRGESPNAGGLGMAGNPAAVHAALGWRAVTVGDDLVKVLCEAIGGRTSLPGNYR